MYQPALSAETLLTRAGLLSRTGRAAAARPLLAAARSLGGDRTAIDALDASLLLGDGRTTEALALLDTALGRDPDAAALLLARAEARVAAGDPAGAAADAAQAVLATPAEPAPKASLGIALAALGRLAEAIACLREAVAADGAHPVYRIALARAQQAAGAPRQARATLAEGIAHAPASLALRHEAVRAARDAADLPEPARLTEAARVAQAACRAGILDAGLLAALGDALLGLDRQAEAADAFAEARKLAPEDAYLRHRAAAAGLLPAPDRAPDAFVRAVFEQQAERYDADMAARGYAAPAALRDAALACGLPAGPALDLGCGTGLVGRALAPLRLALHGIDLSPAMLRHAAASGHYTALHEAGIEAALAAPGPRFAAAFAAGSLCFTGRLDPLLRALHARLPPDGAAFLTLAAGDDGAPWRLLPHGLYTHNADYVAAAAAQAGWRVARLDRGRLPGALLLVLAAA